ncbi:hypothetical protein NUU61_007455 [Penicillium alfredii]|uniref:Uncharacterized protein n=1 Tax=Penicillium alfredii TaxID=1506179 RepID=A0A9W9F2T0_9EURO|nr:uncharacterized protein NUU61_007455 [Penicillium alfredii]KAJ5092585.1 hypothetical protein NUU61_007455 [Penicillium alfredii]
MDGGPAEPDPVVDENNENYKKNCNRARVGAREPNLFAGTTESIGVQGTLLQLTGGVAMRLQLRASPPHMSGDESGGGVTFPGL